MQHAKMSAAKKSVISNEELACTYAMLILIDDDVAVTSNKISTILKAANVDVEPFWPGLFAKSVEGLNAKEFITKIGSGSVAGGAPVAAGGRFQKLTAKS